MPSFKFKHLIRTLACAVALTTALGAAAAPVEMAGVKFQDRAQLGASKLVLNGAGVRYRTIFKVYAAGLYLSRKASTPDEVTAAPGAKRIQLVMLRDLEADQISRLFISGITKNIPPSESTRLTPTMLKLADALTSVKKFVPGDALTIEFDPATGTTFKVNGKQRSDTIPGPIVFDATISIWLGSDPADWALKDALLGK